MQEEAVKFNGYVYLELKDKYSGELIKNSFGNNKIIMVWKNRFAAYLGGFGGVDANEIRPNEMIAFTNAEAAESGTSSLTTSMSNVTTSGLTGGFYFDNGNLDISYLGNGAVLYKGDFSPGEDGVTNQNYYIKSFRLATDAGTTTVGLWTADSYAPVAAIKIKESFPVAFPDGQVVVKPSEILIVRWILTCVNMNETSGGTGVVTDGSGGGGTGTIGFGTGKVLCTELFRQGKLNRNIYMADSLYSKIYLNDNITSGYRTWAIPIAKLMKKNSTVTNILEPFIKSWATHMAYKMGAVEKDDDLGYILEAIGIPISEAIGKLKSSFGKKSHELSK